MIESPRHISDPSDLVPDRSRHLGGFSDLVHILMNQNAGDAGLKKLAEVHSKDCGTFESVWEGAGEGF
jgi:hypothetical protein